VAYIAVAESWETRNRSPVTGDEPQYLIMADALATDHSLELSRAYARDAVSHRIGAEPGDHSVISASGTFNIHQAGLPILIAPVFSRFGLIGVRVTLCVFAASIPVMFFALARLSGLHRADAAVLASAAAFGLPFLAAAGQVYPDLPSGVLLLFLVTVACGVARGRTFAGWQATAALALALLPWLHVKNALAAMVMCGTLLHLSRAAGGRPRWPVVARLCIPLALSMGLLLAFNARTLGGVFGALSAQAVAGAGLRQAGMILLGLHFDQLEGAFFQQPLFLAGLAGLPLLFARSRALALGLSATYLAVLLPNSFHPCWYGCFSIGGRFQSSVIALWFVPLLSLYVEVTARGRLMVLAGAGVAVAWQLFLMMRWASWGPLHFYSVMTTDVLARNSLVVTSWRPFLPSFFDFRDYLTRAPNLAALAAGAAILGTGLVLTRGARMHGGRKTVVIVSRRSRVLAALAVVGFMVAALIWRGRMEPIILLDRFADAVVRPAGAREQVATIRSAGDPASRRRILCTRPPARVTWRVTLPDDAVLSVGAIPETSAAPVSPAEVTFRVGVSDGSGYKELSVSRIGLGPVASPWVEITVDLTRYSGRTVEIIFNTAADGVGGSDVAACWGEPMIRTRG
jgi:hypothetical protein